MAFRIHNTADYLLIEDVSDQNITYYLKSELSVAGVEGNVVLYKNGNELLALGPADIDLPSENALYDLVTTIHGYLYSDSTSQGDLREVQKQITTAEVLALNGTPISIITGIPGSEIQIIAGSVHLKYAGATYATNTDMVFKSSSAGAADYQGKYSIAGTTDRIGNIELITTTRNIVTGDDLVATVLSGNPVTGNSDVVVSILYRVTDLP
jgi:hypothetical protein